MARLDDLGEPSRGRGRERCTEQPAGWNQLVVALVGGALLEQFDDLLRHIHRATLPRVPRVITSAAQRFMAGRMGAHTCEVAALRASLVSQPGTVAAFIVAAAAAAAPRGWRSPTDTPLWRSPLEDRLPTICW